MRIFAVKTFANCPKIAKFAKVFTRERFPLYGNKLDFDSTHTYILYAHFITSTCTNVQCTVHCSNQHVININAMYMHTEQYTVYCLLIIILL